MYSETPSSHITTLFLDIGGCAAQQRLGPGNAAGRLLRHSVWITKKLTSATTLPSALTRKANLACTIIYTR